MKGHPLSFWGKLKQSDGQVNEWHPLMDHCADVSACCEALIETSVLRQRLAHLGGLQDLDPVQCARLCVLAALHDIGKFNHGFQNKSDPTAKEKAGHVQEVLALFGRACRETDALIEALSVDEMVTWFEDESSCIGMLAATLAHHGRPVPLGQGYKVWIWRTKGSIDPFQGIKELAKATRTWFPSAWCCQGSPIPSPPVFQHAFNGLVTLADWLGSDEHIFSFTRDDCAFDRLTWSRGRALHAIREIGLDCRTAAETLSCRPIGFDLVSGYPPRPAQQAMLEIPADAGGSLVVLEAETGAGKTEAALIRYLELLKAGQVEGMYFALPTRTAATQIHCRVVEAIRRAFPDESSRPPVVLAVPGYLRVDAAEGTCLPHFEVLWNDDERERWRFRGWAAERPKRYLAGAVVVGTIDQALLSALAVNHSHLRATSLLRHLLVIDEVHASDAYMTRILEEVLARHLGAGGHALLMSATIQANVRDRILAVGRPVLQTSKEEALAIPFPVLFHRRKQDSPSVQSTEASRTTRQVSVVLASIAGDVRGIARMALEAADQGARVLVVRNTVRDCCRTQIALETLAQELNRSSLLMNSRGMPVPHHSRYSRLDRQHLDGVIEAAFGKNRPEGGLVAVATQTVQQSLDLDSDLLMTDLCPMDVMLQREGRLHRHERSRRAPGYETPKLVVLVPEERDLGKHLDRDGKGRGPHGLGTVYDNLLILEATWRLLETQNKIAIPKDCRFLVESAQHWDVQRALSEELGGTWKRHHQTVLGSVFAGRRLGQLNLANWNETFGDTPTLFGSSQEMDRRILTRIGQDDRLATFTTPWMGPFGNLIHELTISAHLARNVPADAVPEILETQENVVKFQWGTSQYIYDRLGLRTPDELGPSDDHMIDVDSAGA